MGLFGGSYRNHRNLCGLKMTIDNIYVGVFDVDASEAYSVFLNGIKFVGDWEWGNTSERSKALAYAILVKETERPDTATECCGLFTAEIISRLDNKFRLTSKEINGWMESV